MLVAGLAFVLPATMTGCGGALRIGYTNYQPMNYDGEDGELIGHDVEFAEKALGELGYEYKFVRIEWNKKVLELNSGNIDLIWNGMTITEELQDAMLITIRI